MQTNSNFEEILLAFNDAEVKYLVVGAYAVAALSQPRATGDIDLWVEASTANARRVFRALAAFGAPMEKVDGVLPIRIDVLTSIDGGAFRAQEVCAIMNAVERREVATVAIRQRVYRELTTIALRLASVRALAWRLYGSRAALGEPGEVMAEWKRPWPSGTGLAHTKEQRERRPHVRQSLGLDQKVAL